MRTRAVVVAVVAVTVVSATAQLRVSSPYLDVVERYRSGDYQRAIDEVAGFPASNLRERARRDLTELPCQVLTGTADCTAAREQKPREFERVIDVWATSLPAAAALHIDAAVATQRSGRLDVSTEHQRLAQDLAERALTAIPVGVAGRNQRVEVRRHVWLLSIWLLQLRHELKELEMLLTKAKAIFLRDGALLLASGSFHEVQARPWGLLDASESRQGNLEAWRLTERTWRLKSAESDYREATNADPTLAEAWLRLGRVLALQSRRDEAHVALARVPELTTDTRWRYLALLFRAAAYEADGKSEATEPSYRGALEVWPSSQAARLGLSRLRAERGAWDEARKELDGVGGAGGSGDDPWWAYDFGQAWRIESDVTELRKLVPR
jgi:tetratricopeptide (TPR) repeat protein